MDPSDSRQIILEELKTMKTGQLQQLQIKALNDNAHSLAELVESVLTEREKGKGDAIK